MSNIPQRKETLLEEFHRDRLGKSNVVVDRRFGEKDENMSVEDKMMLRFRKQKLVCKIQKCVHSVRRNLHYSLHYSQHYLKDLLNSLSSRLYDTAQQ